MLPGQKAGWVKQPSEYIYVYEPPALPMHKPLLKPDLCHLKGIREPYNYFHWHFNTGPSSVFDIANDGQKAISPILFVDGHAAQHDFTRELRRDPFYPTEPPAGSLGALLASRLELIEKRLSIPLAFRASKQCHLAIPRLPV